MEWVKFFVTICFTVIGYFWFLKQIKREIRDIGELNDTSLRILQERINDLEVKIVSLENDDDSYIEDWEEEEEDRSWDGDEGSYIEDLEEEKEDRSWDGA